MTLRSTRGCPAYITSEPSRLSSSERTIRPNQLPSISLGLEVGAQSASVTTCADAPAANAARARTAAGRMFAGRMVIVGQCARQGRAERVKCPRKGVVVRGEKSRSVSQHREHDETDSTRRIFGSARQSRDVSSSRTGHVRPDREERARRRMRDGTRSRRPSKIQKSAIHKKMYFYINAAATAPPMPAPRRALAFPGDGCFVRWRDGRRDRFQGVYTPVASPAFASGSNRRVALASRGRRTCRAS